MSLAATRSDVRFVSGDGQCGGRFCRPEFPRERVPVSAGQPPVE